MCPTHYFLKLGASIPSLLGTSSYYSVEKFQTQSNSRTSDPFNTDCGIKIHFRKRWRKHWGWNLCSLSTFDIKMLRLTGTANCTKVKLSHVTYPVPRSTRVHEDIPIASDIRDFYHGEINVAQNENNIGKRYVHSSNYIYTPRTM